MDSKRREGEKKIRLPFIIQRQKSNLEYLFTFSPLILTILSIAYFTGSFSDKPWLQLYYCIEPLCNYLFRMARFGASSYSCLQTNRPR
jgi:hypothetical protein